MRWLSNFESLFPGQLWHHKTAVRPWGDARRHRPVSQLAAPRSCLTRWRRLSSASHPENHGEHNGHEQGWQDVPPRRLPTRQSRVSEYFWYDKWVKWDSGTRTMQGDEYTIPAVAYTWLFSPSILCNIAVTHLWRLHLTWHWITAISKCTFAKEFCEWSQFCFSKF